MKTDVENLLEGHGISPDFKYRPFPSQCIGGEGSQLLIGIFARLAEAPPRENSGEQLLLTDIFDQLAKKTT